MPRFDFPQVSPSGSAKFVPLADLKRALATERLYGHIWPEASSTKTRTPGSNRYVNARPPRHPSILKAEQWSEAQILSDLRNGSLVGHVTSEKGAFRMVPPDYWMEDDSGLSVGGTLYDVPGRGMVPESLSGSTILIFEEPAYLWLLERKINEDNPDYPRCLRKGRPLKTAKLPPESEIKAKMFDLIESGYSKNDAAKRIGLLPGFKGVGNAHARRTVEGSGLRPGRRPKG